jgi:hypothetical protein
MMRRTVASPIPLPSNSSGVCHALKSPEEIAGVGHVEARPVVAHVINGLSVHLRGADLDARARPEQH